ncbi:P-loop containing nucleoside triphosphate hydrolase protein [Schizophyllum amplum]|uniref:P-loop containing nucleoside triphosphate hydrolase protein n=1 Tax=Schizophyllum amplum TaxID=97359 RepID=A0A550CQH7_9AGAR|nr:P-loop containing nucleoside triphosphate hydrolase protein [Auriculariopsis ampla]
MSDNEVQSVVADAPIEWKIETKHLEEHYDDKGYKEIVEAGERPPKTDDEDKWRNYVLTYTRHFDKKGFYQNSTVEIKSSALKEILKTVINDYPGVSFATERVVLPLPSRVLLHHRADLYTALRQGTVGDEEGRKHLKFFLEWYEDEDAELIKSYTNLIDQGLVTYPLLWTVLRPGCTIYAPLHGQPRAFRLNSSYESRDFHVLDVSYTDYDGRKFGLTDTELHVFPFLGSAPINSLEAYPLAYHVREQHIRDQLIKRGRRFESLQGKQYLSYSGIALGEVVRCRRVRYSINGRVMVDCETFSRMETDRAISVKTFRSPAQSSGNSSDDEDSDDEEDSGYDSDFAEGKGGPVPLTEEQCLHATNLACGFAFAEKKWVEFYVDKLAPIEWSEDAFDHLVLPARQKGIVKALVESHMKEASEGGFDDVIKGKGRGLISILHGPPGVGKTLTAESVAEFTKRPLYAVSSGELGTYASDLEDNLSRILDVATVWKAVLLLDEADVFLEKRSLHDVDRNALVSTFLRLLEYYQGILFLTTNRVQSFDEAFQSRIHVALKYNDLTEESRRTVWKSFLTKLGPGKADLSEAEYDELQKSDLNGRQIKNAVKTANSLADSLGGKVTKETLETVLDIQRDFERDFRAAGEKGFSDA